MELIEIGIVIKPQGIKGEVKVKHYCDAADDFLGFTTIYLGKDGKKLFEIIKARGNREYVYLALKGINSRDEAETLRGTLLYVESSELSDLPDDHFYIRDLVGIDVVTTEGKMLGKITDVLQNGAVDVYCVKSETATFMFPALKRVMVKTDIEARQMVLDKDVLAEVVVYED